MPSMKSGKQTIMNRTELEHLIKLGEGQTLEFKRSLSEDYSRELSAFANSLGGTLLIGVDDHGVIVGIDNINKAKAQLQNTARSLEPPLPIRIEAVEKVLVVTIPQGPDRPHGSSGRFYLREGATCQHMTRGQIRDYFFHEGLIFFRSRRNP
jgi:ATP-dependent DNA helicase RecG